MMTCSLLLPSPHPTTITHLYLAGNDISLSSAELATFLGTTLSSRQCKLECLNVTSNPFASDDAAQHFPTLLSNLRLGDHSSLSQLHFSLCQLTPDLVEPLTKWLEDPEGGGRRMQVLGMNGNHLSEVGVRRIRKTVIEGKCSGMLQIETLANSAVASEFDPLLSTWKEQEEEGGPIDLNKEKEVFEEAKRRNKVVLQDTRDAALSLLGPARILFCANPRTPKTDVELVRRTVENLKVGGLISPTTPPNPPSFPFLRLPVEIRVNILRCYLLLESSSLAHLYPTITSSSSPSSSPPPSSASASASTPPPPVLSSPLTEAQFLSVLFYASDRTTFSTEIQLLDRAGKFPSINQLSSGWQDAASNAMGLGVDLDTAEEEGIWEDWMLEKTGCDRFERAREAGS